MKAIVYHGMGEPSWRRSRRSIAGSPAGSRWSRSRKST